MRIGGAGHLSQHKFNSENPITIFEASNVFSTKVSDRDAEFLALQ